MASEEDTSEHPERNRPSRLESMLSMAAGIAGQVKSGSAGPPVERDLTLALELVRHAPEIIGEFRKRAEEMESRIEALLESAGQELRAAEARIRQAEQRALAAEGRAKAAQERLEHAEEWIARFTGAIENSFATLRGAPEGDDPGSGRPPA